MGHAHRTAAVADQLYGLQIAKPSAELKAELDKQYGKLVKSGQAFVSVRFYGDNTMAHAGVANVRVMTSAEPIVGRKKRLAAAIQQAKVALQVQKQQLQQVY